VGGRLFEAFSDDPGDVFEVGRVLAWEPGERLVLEWRLTNFAPGERTEVEVRFEAEDGGTRVTIEHRGGSALRPDHPARHGMDGAATVERVALFWGELVRGMRLHLDSG
jgi:uncharacterized protein YndB with AHSA1/START domain